MLAQITPLILTLNEGSNIERTLSRLDWAKDIVVVDSGSTDSTREILARYPRVRVFERAFTTHAEQWIFGLEQTGIATEWVLALDADYVLAEDLVEELRSLSPPDTVGGYAARFTYCVEGKPLRGGIYPPVVVLYRRTGAHYEQDGHTQRVRVNGDVLSLTGRILHDDRKPLRQWLNSQARYMSLEAEHIRNRAWDEMGWADRLRKLRVVAPWVMLGYCLFVRGLILDGWAGVFYSLQRTVSELMLSLYLLEQDFRRAAR